MSTEKSRFSFATFNAEDLVKVGVAPLCSMGHDPQHMCPMNDGDRFIGRYKCSECGMETSAEGSEPS